MQRLIYCITWSLRALESNNKKVKYCQCITCSWKREQERVSSKLPLVVSAISQSCAIAFGWEQLLVAAKLQITQATIAIDGKLKTVNNCMWSRSVCRIDKMHTIEDVTLVHHRTEWMEGWYLCNIRRMSCLLSACRRSAKLEKTKLQSSKYKTALQCCALCCN